jgi:hypothetical protein
LRDINWHRPSPTPNNWSIPAMWTPGIREPPATQSRGLYVDPIYF